MRTGDRVECVLIALAFAAVAAQAILLGVWAWSQS